MDINDIEQKQDNEFLLTIIDRLGIPSVETLKAIEINAIIEAIKKKADNPVIYGDPLDDYISFRNQ